MPAHRIAVITAAAATALVITGCSTLVTGTATREPPTTAPLAVGEALTLDTVARTATGDVDMVDLGSRALDLIPAESRPTERLWCALDTRRGLGACTTTAADYVFQVTTPTPGTVTLTRAMIP